MTDDNGIGFGPKRLTLKGCAKEIRKLREENEKLQQHFDIRHRDFETVFAEYERARELLEWWIDSMKPHSLDREIFGKTRAFLDGEDK